MVTSLAVVSPWATQRSPLVKALRFKRSIDQIHITPGMSGIRKTARVAASLETAVDENTGNIYTMQVDQGHTLDPVSPTSTPIALARGSTFSLDKNTQATPTAADTPTPTADGAAQTPPPPPPPPPPSDADERAYTCDVNEKMVEVSVHELLSKILPSLSTMQTEITNLKLSDKAHKAAISILQEKEEANKIEISTLQEEVQYLSVAMTDMMDEMKRVETQSLNRTTLFMDSMKDQVQVVEDYVQKMATYTKKVDKMEKAEGAMTKQMNSLTKGLNEEKVAGQNTSTQKVKFDRMRGDLEAVSRQVEESKQAHEHEISKLAENLSRVTRATDDVTESQRLFATEVKATLTELATKVTHLPRASNPSEPAVNLVNIQREVSNLRQRVERSSQDALHCTFKLMATRAVGNTNTPGKLPPADPETSNTQRIIQALVPLEMGQQLQPSDIDSVRLIPGRDGKPDFIIFVTRTRATAALIRANRTRLRGKGYAVFDALSPDETTRFNALRPAFRQACDAGKKATWHRARLFIDGTETHPPSETGTSVGENPPSEPGGDRTSNRDQPPGGGETRGRGRMGRGLGGGNRGGRSE